MEGDSFTLNTDVEKTQHNIIKWYFNDTRIAQINVDLNSIFADDQYVERFRDRLKLDHQTGSLTITNTRTTDCGVYKLQIINSRISEKIFRVSVCGIPVNETHAMKRKSVKEGESVTLDPGAIRHPNDFMKWYFNDSCIAEITGDLSKICTDDLCEHADGRFRNRLKVDHQTGSLTITNIRNTDAGIYKLEINSSSSIRRRHTSSISISSFRSFSVAVIDEQKSYGLEQHEESGRSVAAICAGVGVFLLVSAAVTAGVIYCHHNSTRPGQNDNHVDDLSPTEAPSVTK